LKILIQLRGDDSEITYFGSNLPLFSKLPKPRPRDIEVTKRPQWRG